MVVQIRQFDTNEYEVIAGILNIAVPRNVTTAAHIQDWDENRPSYLKARRWVAERDRGVVGVGEFTQSPDMYNPRKFQIVIHAHPDHQRQGIGSMLYDFVTSQLQSHNPIAYQGRAYADEDRSLRFLLKRGFHEDFRMWESHLAVDSFDPGPWHGIEDRLKVTGIQIKSLIELANDPGRDRQVFDLEREITQEIPSPESITSHREHLSPDEVEERFARYVTRVLHHPDRPLEAYVVAVRDGEYVGLTYFELDREHRRAEILITGVKQDYRGQGIATALKLRGIEFAREHGYHTIVTGNDTVNHSMLAINDRLGFVRQPGLIFFEKSLEVEEDEDCTMCGVVENATP